MTQYGKEESNSPRGLEDLASHDRKLRNDAYDVQVRTICEQEIPKTQHLWQRPCASAKRQNGWESVKLGREAIGSEMHAESGVDYGEDLVH